MIGTQFAWGNISPYVTGYYRDQGYSVRLTDFYSVLPVITITSTIAFPFGMHFAEIYGPRLIFMSGGILGIACTYLSSLTTHPWVFFSVYAIGFGICKGLLYPSVLFAAWSHIPGRKGLASGVVVSGMGVGSFIFGIVT
jgi:OFA family oxalate/formate antiporter-like MFS transporter